MRKGRNPASHVENQLATITPRHSTDRSIAEMRCRVKFFGPFAGGAWFFKLHPTGISRPGVTKKTRFLRKKSLPLITLGLNTNENRLSTFVTSADDAR